MLTSFNLDGFCGVSERKKTFRKKLIWGCTTLMFFFKPLLCHANISLAKVKINIYFVNCSYARYCNPLKYSDDIMWLWLAISRNQESGPTHTSFSVIKENDNSFLFHIGEICKILGHCQNDAVIPTSYQKPEFPIPLTPSPSP